MPGPGTQGEDQLSNRSRTYLALALVAALLTTAVPASATPSKAAKMAQARAVAGQISSLQDRIEVANENYNEAKSKHAVLLAQTRTAARREKKAKRRIAVLQVHLGTRASDMYRTGPLGFLDVLLGAKSFDELASTWDILKDLNRDDSKAIAQMKVAKAEAAAAHDELSAKEQASAKQVAVMNAQLDARNSHMAELRAKQSGIEAELRAINAAEEAAALQAARSNPRGGGGYDRAWPNPTIPAHGSVVTYARSRLGCRYVWAGTGPRVFDCSGFTMWCYRQVGISLPHSSRAQINIGQRVSRANLQPGDLVFFGSPIHHVGIYIGGGMMIHAPHSGDVVKVAPAFRSNYVGASRP